MRRRTDRRHCFLILAYIQLSNLLELQSIARSIFNSALNAVDARSATRHAITLNKDELYVADSKVSRSPIYVIGIGKAALSMANGVDDSIGDRVSEGIIVSPHNGNYAESTLGKWRFMTGGHPVPDQNSLDAAQEIFDLLSRANAEGATVLFLVSGGGSAMVELAVSRDISLDDLQEANRILVTSGASIAEINSVRRGFSAVKGGGLARAVPHADVITLIVSDTNDGDEASVASGPTLSPPSNAPDAVEVISRHRLEGRLPNSVLRAINRAEHAAAIEPAPHYVLLQNETALKSAGEEAVSHSFICEIDHEVCEQPIQEGCELLLNELETRSVDDGYCLISGGEFSCPVRGDGKGGRNLETVLRCAIELDRRKQKERIIVLSCGTDGIDGNSTAAGAIADNTTISRAKAIGLDATDYLVRSDSFNFFEKLGDLIVTGPTGTNVRDVRVLLKQ